MRTRIDSLAFPVDCPKCGYETEKTFRWLKYHQEFSCPACGVQGTVDNDAYQGISEQAAKLDRQLQAISKSLKIPF